MTFLDMISVFYTIVFVLVIYNFARELSNVLHTMKPAQGVVVDNIAKQRDGRRVWAPVVEFTDHQGRLHRGEMKIYQSPAKKIGTRVGLRFNPDDPTEISHSSGRLVMGIALACACLVIGLMIIRYAGS